MDILQSGALSNGGVQPATGYTPAAKAPSNSSVVNNSETPVASTPAQIESAVDKINRVVQGMAKDLKFSVDAGTGMSVVQVVDTATKEVIRQFPTEEVLHIAHSLDKLQGLLLKHKA